MSVEIPSELLRRLSDRGVAIQKSRDIDHGTQYRLSDGPKTATLNVYSSGKTSEGGPEGDLRALLREYRVSRGSTGRKSGVFGKRAARTSGGVIPNATPRVGTDEAGKGEYLGPLVVAGVRVRDEEEDERLRDLGVRDSKDLSPSRASSLAREIISSLTQDAVRAVCLSPREYHRRRTSAGSNVNRLLGELNVEVIGELGREVEVAVVDAFGTKAGEYVSEGLGGALRVEARPRAEDDAAVAAASIVARARYLEGMDSLSEEVGFELPRGSTHVLEAAARVYEERGEDGLRDVAKFHFATTRQVIELVESRKSPKKER